MNEPRTLYLDYLRVSAILAMIMLHVAADGVGNYNIYSEEWITSNIYDSAVRWCVPVFVMISGSLFLGRNIPFKKLIKKYILRILVVYIVWNIAYGAYNAHINPFYDNILKGHFHLWFLPMIAMLYVCQPIMRCITKNKNASQLYIILCVIFVFCYSFANKVIEIRLGGESKLLDIQLLKSINFKVSEYSCYFILGYYLANNHVTRKWRYLTYLSGMISLVITITFNYKASMFAGQRIYAFYSYGMINTFFTSAALFLLYKSINFHDSSFYRHFIIKLSKWSLGAYLLHAFLLDLFLGRDITGMHIQDCNPWLYIPVVTIIIAILSYAVSALLNQVPFINKYIV